MIKNLVLLIILHLNVVCLSAQTTIPVIARHFKVYAADTTYNRFSERLPDLLCKGIFYHSALSPYTGYQFQSTSRIHRLFRVLESDDLAMVDSQRKTLDSLHVSYVIGGSIVFNKDNFSLFVNSRNFKSPPLIYEVKLQPLSQFLSIIDEACLSLNRLIQMDMASQQAMRISVQQFSINFGKRVYAHFNDNIYSPGYFSVFLSQYLQNSDSGWYVIRPYVYKTDSLATAAASPLDRRNDLYISGNVTFKDDSSLIVQPVCYQKNGDSVILAPFSGTRRNREQLSKDVLDYIQSYLEATINGDTYLHGISASFTRVDYIRAFKEAYASGQLKQASFYATELLWRDQKYQRTGTLFKAMVSYKKGNYEQTIASLAPMVSLKPMSLDAVYFTGMSYCKLGRYRQARDLLEKIPDSLYRENVHYYRALCGYYLDSLNVASVEFNKQLHENNLYEEECHYYLGMIAAHQRRWTTAEMYLKQAYDKEPGNPIYAEGIKNFYKGYLVTLVLDGAIDDSTADAVITKGIRDSLLFADDMVEIGNMLSLLLSTAKDSMKSMRPAINRVIRVFNLYRSLRRDMDEKALELEAYLYVNVGDLDAAIRCYRNILPGSIYDKQKGIILLSLGELYILKNDFTRADSTFRYIQGNIYGDSTRNYDVIIALLLDFYQAELSIITLKDTSASSSTLNAVLLQNRPAEMLNNWTFGSFYTWIVQQHFPSIIRGKLLGNLCIISTLSGERYPCK